MFNLRLNLLIILFAVATLLRPDVIYILSTLIFVDCWIVYLEALRDIFLVVFLNFCIGIFILTHVAFPFSRFQFCLNPRKTTGIFGFI